MNILINKNSDAVSLEDDNSSPFSKEIKKIKKIHWKNNYKHSIKINDNIVKIINPWIKSFTNMNNSEDIKNAIKAYKKYIPKIIIINDLEFTILTGETNVFIIEKILGFELIKNINIKYKVNSKLIRKFNKIIYTIDILYKNKIINWYIIEANLKYSKARNELTKTINEFEISKYKTLLTKRKKMSIRHLKINDKIYKEDINKLIFNYKRNLLLYNKADFIGIVKEISDNFTKITFDIYVYIKPKSNCEKDFDFNDKTTYLMYKKTALIIGGFIDNTNFIGKREFKNKYDDKLEDFLIKKRILKIRYKTELWNKLKQYGFLDFVGNFNFKFDGEILNELFETNVFPIWYDANLFIRYNNKVSNQKITFINKEKNDKLTSLEIKILGLKSNEIKTDLHRLLPKKIDINYKKKIIEIKSLREILKSEKILNIIIKNNLIFNITFKPGNLLIINSYIYDEKIIILDHQIQLLNLKKINIIDVIDVEMLNNLKNIGEYMKNMKLQDVYEWIKLKLYNNENGDLEFYDPEQGLLIKPIYNWKEIINSIRVGKNILINSEKIILNEKLVNTLKEFVKILLINMKKYEKVFFLKRDKEDTNINDNSSSLKELY